MSYLVGRKYRHNGDRGRWFTILNKLFPATSLLWAL